MTIGFVCRMLMLFRFEEWIVSMHECRTTGREENRAGDESWIVNDRDSFTHKKSFYDGREKRKWEETLTCYEHRFEVFGRVRKRIRAVHGWLGRCCTAMERAGFLWTKRRENWRLQSHARLQNENKLMPRMLSIWDVLVWMMWMFFVTFFLLVRKVAIFNLILNLKFKDY